MAARDFIEQVDSRGLPWRGKLASMDLKVNALSAQAAVEAAMELTSGIAPTSLAQRDLGLDELDAIDEASRALRAKADEAQEEGAPWAPEASGGGAWTLSVAYACDTYGGKLRSYSRCPLRLAFSSPRPHADPDASDGEGHWRARLLSIDEGSELSAVAAPGHAGGSKRGI